MTPTEDVNRTKIALACANVPSQLLHPVSYCTHPQIERCADSSERLNSSAISFGLRVDAEVQLQRREEEFLSVADEKVFNILGSFQLELKFMQECFLLLFFVCISIASSAIFERDLFALETLLAFVCSSLISIIVQTSIRTWRCEWQMRDEMLNSVRVCTR